MMEKTMKKIIAVFALVFAMLALTFAYPAHAQKPGKVWRIGILTSAWAVWHSNTKGFREGLKEFGYVEGRNVTFHSLAAKGNSRRLPGMAAELVRKKPDLLYCVAAPDAQACQKATRTIPIVFTQTGDPVKLGLVRSLARPGGNLTGVGSLRAEMAGKRLQIFKELVPFLRRVVVTYDPREPEEVEAVKSVREAAARIGVILIERPITSPAEIDDGLVNLKEGGEDGILIVQANPNLNIPGRSLEAAALLKVPTMYPSSFWTKFGALASYGPNQFQQGRQAARFAHKILNGTPPREIPVELPTDIEFAINLNTATKIGLKVPPEVLFLANRVFR
jgi:putative ABC transport system substrate-binding protein